MKKIKEIISRLLTIPMVVSIFPTTAFASDIETESLLNLNNLNSRATYVGTTGLADSTLLTPSVNIPPHTINNTMIAYCMNPEKNSPIDTPMTLDGNYDSDAVIRGLLYYGYPHNATNLKEKHGLTDWQAQGITQFAVWKHRNPTYHQDRSHPYLNELLSLARTASPSATMNLSTGNPSVSISGGTQVSEVINTSSSYKGTFSFPSDANVYTTDVNGNKKNSFSIGESFKIVAEGSVQGNITRNITVALTEPSMLRFVPTYDSSVQELGVPSTKTVHVSIPVTINFAGATGEIVVNKVSDTGDKLKDVEFGLYSDSAANNIITTKTTNADGKVVFDNLNIGTTYYVKELSSVEGYIMDSTIKTVAVNSTTQSITVTNTKIMGQIKIIKNETGNTSKKLKGAEFNILDSSNSVVDTIITDENGEATSKLLPYGDYKVVETKAPTGYVLNSREISVKITEHNKTYSFDYENDIIKGKIEILKLDAEGNNPLKGVKFGIYNANTDALIEELVTGEDGRVTSSELVYGNYYVKEIQPLNGYVIDTKKYAVDITENNKVYIVDVFNSKIIGDVSIIKIDAETGKPLANVEFKIECVDGFDVGKTWFVTTDENGIGKANGLKHGGYEIVEIRTLSGYLLDTTAVPFTITADGQKIEKTISNKKIKGSFELLKYDPETKEPLANVEFEIECLDGFNKGDKYIFVTDENGLYKGNDIPYGRYKIVEIKTLEGYVLDAEPIYFELTEDGQEIEITKENRKIYGELDFSKTDLATGEIVEGAHIKITGLDEINKDVEVEFISSADGNKIKLPYGKYQIVETIAPEGYVKTEEVGEFEILEDGQIIQAEIKNKRIMGSLVIHKLAENTNVPLAGAEFGVYDENDNLVTKVITDENGYAEVLDLVYGNYYYTELKAPDGYLVNLESYDFSIEYDGQVIEETVYNRLLNPFPDRGDNSKTNPLPDTSGINILMLMGAVFVVGACIALVNRKKIKA